MNYIKGFDGLRAFSICLVLIGHLGFWPEEDGSGNFGWALLLKGSSGVYIFFALSGFLITSILLKEKEKKGHINFKNFFIRRFLRLLPTLFVLYAVLLVLYSFQLLPFNWGGFLLSLFYVYNFTPLIFHSPELAHTWSLGVEEQFYLIWAFVVGLFTKARIILIALILLLACFILPTLYACDVFFYKGHTWSVNTIFWDPHHLFFPAIAPIMVGSIIACINIKTDFLKRMTAFSWFLLLPGIIFCAHLYLPAGILVMLPENTRIGLSFSLLLAYIYHNQNSLVTQFMEFKPIAYLGKISYGVYVWQGLFLRNGPGGDLFIQKFPQNIVLTLLVAVLSYEMLELPILKLKKRYS